MRKTNGSTMQFTKKLVKLLQDEFMHFSRSKIETCYNIKTGEAFITINRRDVHLSPSGRVYGAGTYVGPRPNREARKAMKQGRQEMKRKGWVFVSNTESLV